MDDENQRQLNKMIDAFVREYGLEVVLNALVLACKAQREEALAQDDSLALAWEQQVEGLEHLAELANLDFGGKP